MFKKSGLIVFLFLVLSVTEMIKGQVVVDIDFADGLLPSAHGFDFLPINGQNEASIFNVSDGVLSWTGGGRYTISDIPDPASGFVLEFRLRVAASNTDFGVDFDVSQGLGLAAWEFGFLPDRILQFTNSGTVNKAFLDLTVFQDFRLEVDNEIEPYRFFANDNLIFTGSAWTNSDSERHLLFADGEPGVIADAELDYLLFSICPEPTSLGDVNLDGSVNLLDVQPFVDLVSNGTYQPEADMNGDCVVNLLDVDPFVAILSGG